MADGNGLISIEREILIVCVFVTLSLYFSGISSNTEPVEKSVDQKLMNKTESNIAKTGNSDISTSNSVEKTKMLVAKVNI